MVNWMKAQAMWLIILAIVGISFVIDFLTPWFGSLLIPLVIGAIAATIAVIGIIVYSRVSEDESKSVSKGESDIIRVKSGPDRIRANYISKTGSSIGGELLLRSDSVVFSPNKLEEVFGRKAFEISYEEVKGIEKVPKRSDGLVAILLRNGLSDRIQINLENGDNKLFSTSDIKSAFEMINKAISDK